MGRIDAETFITEQLMQAGIDYKLSKNFINVSCVYHEHSGTKKKLGFSRSTGGMHCFSCKKEGHWNEFADQVGLDKFDEEDRRLQDFQFLKREFDRLREVRVPEAPEWLEPWIDEWRGLSAEFLATIPSYKWHDEGSKANRILWPVFANDKFKGCTAARINPDDTMVFPKTRNLGGMDAQKLLFPFDHPLVRESKTVVLVEGQFDALRLLSFGIPAVSIIGAGAWDEHKLTMLGTRNVDRLVLAFDGDLAGERLTDRVKEPAEKEFDVRLMHFPDPDEEDRARGFKSIDPGNCKMKYVKLIKRLCR